MNALNTTVISQYTRIGRAIVCGALSSVVTAILVNCEMIGGGFLEWLFVSFMILVIPIIGFMIHEIILSKRNRKKIVEAYERARKLP